MMTWKTYIFIVGAWSQWDREVVVVEAEKMKDLEEMAVYVKWMDRHPFFLLLQVVVPRLQSRLRNFWSAEVWHVVFNAFKRPPYLPFLIKSNIPWYVEGY